MAEKGGKSFKFNLGEALKGAGWNPEATLWGGDRTAWESLAPFSTKARDFFNFKKQAQEDARAGLLPFEDLSNIPPESVEDFNRSLGIDRPYDYRPTVEGYELTNPSRMAQLDPPFIPATPPIEPIRSPYPTPTTTPTERTMIRALQPGMRGPSGPPPTRIPSWRPFLRGGPLALGVASSLFSPRAEAPMKTPRRVYEDVTNPLHMSPVYFTDEDSPFRKQLPHSLFPPGYLRERAGRNAVEGVRQNLLGNLSLLPSTTSGALTPQELFKQRNDAEELRIREGSLPVIPEVPEWNPQASIPPDFRVNETSMASLSPGVTYTTPPVVPPVSREQEIENMMIRDRMENLKYLPGHPLYEAPFEAGTGPMAEAVIPRVETFAEPRTAWTPPAPVIPDIVVPPPAAAPTPYVEQFEEITPPRKVEQRQPSQRAPKVVKKKATKAKPKPRRVKQTAVQKALAKPAPRRVKYTPPKPKSKTPVTRRKGGKPKVRRVSKAPRRPGGR